MHPEIPLSLPNFIISYTPFNLLPGVLALIAYILHVCNYSVIR